ncbi:flagellar hook protein FlgE [Stakelama sp. CBK3Z-3]|uniref:Flagellar hook protein FlgE n=1 Tax=Stakelama flava TaxID=2860338 RepID=A0ABS6XJQ8_9SPHN|nr:flagellar hook protein FlgE [Stakelama flava]MBW4330443.1 flagellar hook protein FlgE [Stakelama flava]
MSLYSALYAGVSGLSAESFAMAAVADNITNINTVGYKGTDTQFRTLVTDSGLKSSYSAGGVAASPQALISKQGLLQASSNSTDLGIEGAGFFVTRTGPDANADVAFTRAGSFKPDESGYLRNASGLYLMGWRLDAEGGFTNTGNINGLEAVRVSDLTGSAAATSSIDIRANLQSSAEALATPYNAGDMATGAVEPTFSRSFDVYDAQGGTHRVTMSFVKTGANQWQGEVYADPSEVTAANGLLASGEIRFNSDGSPIIDDTQYTSAMFDPLAINWTNGAGAQTINMGLGTNGGLSGLSQFGSESALITSDVDGGMLGTISSVQVSDDGVVSAVFDNGVTRDVFQLPIATFANPDGLTRMSGNAYMVSDQSGAYAINRPGALGSGVVRAGTLEASTVDLAEEFSNMIRFQRAYSASSKIITTVDDMLQEVSNLKR